MEKKYEFMGYQPVTNDQYMTGIASIRLYGKIVLRYKEVKSKDGAGSFFTMTNYTITNPQTQEKKYIQPVMIEFRSEEAEILEIIREGVNRAKSQTSVFSSNASHSPSSMKEVAADEHIPF